MTSLTTLEILAFCGFAINLLGLVGIGVQVGRVLSRLSSIERRADDAHTRIDELILGEGA